MMMARRTNVPAPIAAEITTTLEHWYDLVGGLMTSDAGRRIVREDIGRGLAAGTLETAWVIAAANAGHQDADLALRAFASTFADQGRWEELPRQVQGYAAGALLVAPTTYPRGKNFIDTWTRDLGIAVMVKLASARWELPATRSLSTEAPSASYFVALVLHRRGFKLKEQQVARIYRDHTKMAARLAASVEHVPFENSS
jgi:hypothetical protein